MVGYDHNSVKLGEFNVETIKAEYLSRGLLEKIRSWYKQKLSQIYRDSLISDSGSVIEAEFQKAEGRVETVRLEFINQETLCRSNSCTYHHNKNETRVE